jgi:hypothetical protein
MREVFQRRGASADPLVTMLDRFALTLEFEAWVGTNSYRRASNRSTPATRILR